MARPRETRRDTTSRHHDDADMARRRVRIIWKKIRGGIWIHQYIEEPPVQPGPRKAPACGCNLYGSPRRQPGPHHDEDCERREPW